MATTLNGVSLAFNTVTVNPALAECATPQSMGRVIGVGGMSANGARIFAPVLWGSLYHIHWTYTYYASTAVGLSSVLAFGAARLYTAIESAAWWMRRNTIALIARTANRAAAIQRLMHELEHVLTTRGYAPEEEETEELCRALIDKAFPDLTEEVDPSEQAIALREHLAVLQIQSQSALVEA